MMSRPMLSAMFMDFKPIKNPTITPRNIFIYILLWAQVERGSLIHE
jgi:hypothetical protein